MVSLFKDRSPANVIWIVLLTVAVHGHFFIDPPQLLPGVNDGLLSIVFNKFLSGFHPALLVFIYHALVITQALRLNYLFNDQRMFMRASFLVGMSYVLITAVFKEWSQLTPALAANGLVIWLFAKTVRLYNNANPKTLLFNIGLIIGLSVLLYHPTSLLVIVALFAVIVVRPFNITEILVMFMGVLAPFYFLAVYLFLTDSFSQFLQFIPALKFNLPSIKTPVLFFVNIGILILLLLIGIANWQDKNRRMLIQVRKNWGVLVVMLLVLIPTPFINRNAGWETLLLWCVPLSPFISYAFPDTKNNVFPNIIFWLLFLTGVVNNWGLISLIKK